VKMWGGRFSGETDARFSGFSSSVGFDVRLFPYDVRCTAAWAAALGAAGVVTRTELEAVESALAVVAEELEAGTFEFLTTDEDIHTAVERRLVELEGPAGGKVRTGRSRNDQVATDLRLLVMDACDELAGGLSSLQLALIQGAKDTRGAIVAGHTHLQQAQPVLLAHLLMAFVEMLERDVERIAAARAEADCMPLGSGALAGTSVPVDRESLASRLGFSRVSTNSVDAVSDRDFVCQALFAVTMVMVHLSRLAEQIILWCSQEFSLAVLDDAWATGSSLMPQKKNPDGPELVRGKTGRVAGALVSMLTVLKGLPLAYNRDLQEDKEPLFDALDTTLSCLEVMAGTVGTMSFTAGPGAGRPDSGFITATDLAEVLVEGGMDFPSAHGVAGRVVLECERRGRRLSDLTDEELAEFSGSFLPGSAAGLTLEASVARRSAVGGTAPPEVERRILEAESRVRGRVGPL